VKEFLTASIHHQITLNCYENGVTEVLPIWIVRTDHEGVDHYEPAQMTIDEQLRLADAMARAWDEARDRIEEEIRRRDQR
jgi:hypothetical protein